MIAIVTGGSGCGKTILCTRTAILGRARGVMVAGLLTPPRLADGRAIGLDVEDIRTGQRRPLAELAGVAGGPVTRNWHFRTDGLAWGAMVLRRATPCDLLIIDELGPLELVRGQGWQIGLELLRAGRYRLAVVVVRPGLLPYFQESLDGAEPLTLAVTEANRDALPGLIMALLGGDR